MKKLTKLLFAGALALSFAPLGVMALTNSKAPTQVKALSGDGTNANPFIATSYAELKTLFDETPNDGTTRYVTLGNDIASNDSNNNYWLSLTQSNQNLYLDLAGHSISRNPAVTVDKQIIRAVDGSLTIDDSIGGGGVYARGEILYTPISLSFDNYYTDSGEIIIKAGTYEAENNNLSYGIQLNNGSATIYGGTFRGKYGLDQLQCNLKVYGGEFYSTKYAAMMLDYQSYTKIYAAEIHGTVELLPQQHNLNIFDCFPSKTVYVDGVKQAVRNVSKLSGDTIVISTDFVEEIDISIAAPVVGNVMEDTAYVPSGADYTLSVDGDDQILQWFVGDAMVSGTFASLTTYTIKIKVKVTGIIGPNIVAKINGQNANLEFINESMEGWTFYWVDYTFPQTIDNVITSTSVSVTEPSAGGTSTAGIIYNTEKYSVSVGWSTTADGSAAADFNNKTFVAGNTYYADITLVSNDPYVFQENATVFVNAISHTAVWTVGPSYPKYVSVYDVPFECPSDETFTVDFNSNGGSGSMASATDQLGSYVLPECTFTAPADKQFSCWAENSISGNKYASGVEYNVSANVTFFAIWEDIPSFMVSYDSNGGSGTMVGDMVEQNGQFTLESCTFEAPNGKQFAGWAVGSVDATPLKQPGDTITITETTIIYAIWEDVTPVSLSAVYNGGNIVRGNKIDGSQIAITVTYSNDTSSPVGADDVEYWYQGSIINDPINYIFDVAQQYNITVKYAGLEAIMVVNVVPKQFTVTFTAGEGTGSMEHDTHDEGDYTLPTCTFTAPEGKEFAGWKVNGEGELLQPGDKINVDSAITLVACWKEQGTEPEPVKYTISFDDNGGSGTMINVIVDENETYTLPDCGFTAPENQEFVGWKVNDDESLRQPGYEITVTGNVTITAMWKDKEVVPQPTYTVSFDANGGTGTMADVPEISGEYTLPANGFTAPEGQGFAGWKINGEGDLLQPGDSIEVSSNVVLVAQWEDIIYHSVTFNVNGGTGEQDNDGSLIPDGSSFELPECTLTAPEGKEFDYWEVDGGTYNPGDFITMDSDKTIKAVWKDKAVDPVDPEPVTPTPSDGGETTPEQPAKKKGCGGSVIAASSLISIVSLAGTVLLFVKRKED